MACSPKENNKSSKSFVFHSSALTRNSLIILKMNYRFLEDLWLTSLKSYPGRKNDII